MYKYLYICYLSQMRICIEMTFGQLTTKWRIFRSNLNYLTQKNGQIMYMGAKLHNYVIIWITSTLNPHSMMITTGSKLSYYLMNQNILVDTFQFFNMDVNILVHNILNLAETLCWIK